MEQQNNIYEQINTIIKYDLSINILQDKEEISYYLKDKDKFESLSIEELINLKNKIIIKTENENKIGDNNEIEFKYKPFLFFKNIINNLEIINENMKVLRTKGSSLPIKINIKVRDYAIKYFLSDKEVTFDFIKIFLLNAKNKFISILNLIYKDRTLIRLLYGKQFRIIMKHIDSTRNIDSILRYILNNPDNNKDIKEGFKWNYKVYPNYITSCELYEERSLEVISYYIVSVFENNNKTFKDHYYKMKIIPENKYRGIYLHKCEKNSMEEFIVDLFWDKLKQLPIAQNILITNKETTYEEMESFFNRAILCPYNTLFAVEINDSFSECQQSIMNSFIIQLLSLKYEMYNEKYEKNIEKRNTQVYMDSCIVFIYNEQNKNIISFLNEINKFEKQNFENDKNIKEINKDKNNILSKIENKNSLIIVISFNSVKSK